MYIMVLKVMPNFGTFFRVYICGATSPQIGSLLPKSGSASKEVEGFLQRALCLYAHKFQNIAELCL